MSLSQQELQDSADDSDDDDGGVLVNGLGRLNFCDDSSDGEDRDD